MEDMQIDFSDIPKLTEEYLGTLNRVRPRDFNSESPINESCHTMLDEDVSD